MGEKGEITSNSYLSLLSTPKGDGTFNVYEDIRDRLVKKGIPEGEIAFIHSANTDARKSELFAKVRSGQVRFLLGSTQKMGAGTNVQDRLIALHHLDIPWRPADIEQQEGRILRQGNENKKVFIFRYITENTFDSYSWQLIENKQKFISQVMTGRSPVRSCEDIDESVLSYAEVKALATGNPYIKEKMTLDVEVAKLKMMRANFAGQKYRMEDNITVHYPKRIAALEAKVEGYCADIQLYAQNRPADRSMFSMKVGSRVYYDRKEAGTALIEMCRNISSLQVKTGIGEYQGFKMSALQTMLYTKCFIYMEGGASHESEASSDPSGIIQRLDNVLEAMPEELEKLQRDLDNVQCQLEIAKEEVKKPFEKEQEFAEKSARLAELNALLNMDKNEKTEQPENDGAPAEPETVKQQSGQPDAQAQMPHSTHTAEKQEKLLQPAEGKGRPGYMQVRTSVRDKLAAIRERRAAEQAQGQAQKPQIKKDRAAAL